MDQVVLDRRLPDGQHFRGDFGFQAVGAKCAEGDTYKGIQAAKDDE
jgi:hypothetical protein